MNENNFNSNQFVILPKKENGELLQKYEILVYVAIRRFMNKTTMKAYPSLDRISKDTGISKATILKTVKDIVKKGDRIINCHIPGGGKLLDDDVTKSLQLAKKFFNMEPLILTCHSWLLYPPYEEMYGSNMRKFYERWDVVRLDESDEDFWRIFYKEKLEDLCEDDIKTSLQRKMLDFIKNGGKMGAGLAYMILY